MSAPVDVLAMLDERIAVERAGMVEPHKLITVRAAVAELIDAAERTCSTWPQTAHVCGLRDALARCNGGAA